MQRMKEVGLKCATDPPNLLIRPRDVANAGFASHLNQVLWRIYIPNKSTDSEKMIHITSGDRNRKCYEPRNTADFN